MDKVNKKLEISITNDNKSNKESTKQSVVEPKPKRSFTKCVVDHFCDYCSTTGLHGFTYLGQSRTPIEIILWATFILLSIGASIYMINEIYQKYLVSPIIISIASKRTLIHKIPFPAVTICPNTKFDRGCFNYEIIEEKIELNKTITADEGIYYDYAKYMCSNSNGKFLKPDQTTFTEDIFGFLNQCKAASVYSCSYGIGNCTDEWVPILTEEGICYTFNMVNRSEIFQKGVVQYGNFLKVAEVSSWDVETASYMSHENFTDDYPLRSLFTGLDNSLTVIMVEPKDSLNDNCNLDVQGYKVMLHLPVRIPMPSEDFFYMPLGKIVMARIKPAMIITPDSIKAYDSTKRVCYFPSEKRLKFFKIYTQVNCLKECLTMMTYMNCDCVDFHMPRYNITPICGPAKHNCSENAKGDIKIINILSMLFGGEGDIDSFGDLLANDDFKMILDLCDCLPECNEISYDVDASPYEYNWKAYSERPTTDSNLVNSHHMTQLNLYFNSRYVYTLERNELYGISDFISNFGGLIGLFTGFSILSAVEIVYFLSLRLWGNARLYGFWSPQREK